MTFKRSTNKYEIVRFCNKLNFSIIDGTNSMFKYFVNNYNPLSVVVNVNRDYSSGDPYKILNFKLITTTKPNYFYIVNNELHTS